jgi:inner membrane protein
MDSITHVVLGATVGEALIGRKAGKLGMLWGAVAGSLPDLDVLANIFVNDIESLIVHRGYTHSVFIALLAGPLVGWLVSMLHRNTSVSVLEWSLVFSSGMIIHDLLDTCTAYGTALLLPFSEMRFSTYNIFVADPVYTFPLLASSIALLILRDHHRFRKVWVIGGLGLSSIYMIYTFVGQQKAEDVLLTSLNQKGKTPEKYFATPTLLNGILWNVVAADSTGFWTGYYSVFDNSETTQLYFVPKNEALLGSLKNKENIDILKQFSNGFYCITIEQGRLWFNDLRFGQVKGWEDPYSAFAFSFDLELGADNSMVVQKGRLEGSKREALKGMWRRMMGQRDRGSLSH